MNIAIIPARGGSKRIPRKNIKLFHGKPIIAYSIEAAIKSGCFDKVIVSTDDQEIAAIAKEYGAEVPFVRPKELADDYSTTSDVIKHAIEWFDIKGENIDYVFCIYATAPFINSDDILKSFNLLDKAKDAYFCFPVCEFPFPIQRAIKIQNNRVGMFEPENYNVRSQDLEKAYHDVGQFYWMKPEGIKQEIQTFSKYAIPYEISRKRVVDLDTLDDWDYALTLYKVLNA